MIILTGAWSTLLFFGDVSILSDAVLRKRKLYSLLASINLLAGYLSLQSSVYFVKQGLNMHRLIAPLILLTLLQAFLIFDMFRYRSSHVTPMAIKEGLDSLPDGLCYYYDDGMVKLINPAMNALAEEVLGRPVTDGCAFWEHLRDGKALLGTFLETGEHPVFQTAGGTVYSIKRAERSFLKRPLIELIAYEITDEHEQGIKLRESNERLKKQKERLLEMNDTITDLTIEKEILKTKVDIHDDLGKALIAARQYLSNQTDRREMLRIYKSSISLLAADHPGKEEKPDDYATVLKAAGDVGIRVEINGDLPDSEEGRQIVSAAMRECITNTFRHAGGDTLYVKVYEELYDKTTVVELTNNGKAPDHKITETGGLKYLRNLAEQKGVSMSVESAPRFLLRLELMPYAEDQNGREQ